MIELSKQEIESFPHFQTSDQKNYLIKHFSLLPKTSKLIFQMGNEIIQTGNGINSPTSRPLIKKTSFRKCFSYLPRSSKLIFKTENGIIQTGNGINQTENFPKTLQPMQVPACF